MQQVYKKEDMLTVDQFSKAIQMSRRHVYELIEKGPGNGGVEAFRFGNVKGLRIPMEEVDKHKAQRKVDAGA